MCPRCKSDDLDAIGNRRAACCACGHMFMPRRMSKAEFARRITLVEFGDARSKR